jgi:hypothetical protein
MRRISPIFFTYIIFFSLLLPFRGNAQITDFKIQFGKVAPSIKANGQYFFGEELIRMNNFMQDTSIHTRVIIFFDEVTFDSKAEKNLERLIKKYLQGAEANSSTTVWIQPVSNDIFWKDLNVVLDPNDKYAKDLGKVGRSAIHLSSIVIADDNEEWESLKSSFDKTYRGNEHCVRTYSLTSTNKDYHFVEKERFGASCIYNEDSLVVTALASMWNKELVAVREIAKHKKELQRLTDNLKSRESEISDLKRGMRDLQPITSFSIGLSNQSWFAAGESGKLWDGNTLHLKGMAWSSGVIAGYQVSDKWTIQASHSRFMGSLETKDALHWELETEGALYSKVIEVKGFEEELNLLGNCSTIGFSYFPIKDLKHIRVSAGIGWAAMKSANYNYSMDAWNIYRRYNAFDLVIDNVPELGLVNRSDIETSGRLSLRKALFIPLGLQHIWQINPKFQLTAQINRNVVLRNFESESESYNPFSDSLSKGSALSAVSYLPMLKWNFGIHLIYQI